MDQLYLAGFVIGGLCVVALFQSLSIDALHRRVKRLESQLRHVEAHVLPRPPQ